MWGRSWEWSLKTRRRYEEREIFELERGSRAHGWDHALQVLVHDELTDSTS